MDIREEHKVSIVVPVYNSEKKLENCVNSILFQTHKNIEILLINDGSTDKSPEICDNFALIDSRVKVIHKKNTGVSDTRNRGIESSTGEYITFVDSDDCIPDDAVFNLIEPIIKNGVDYVAGDVCHMFDGKRTTRYDEKKINDIATFDIKEIGKCIYYNQGYVYAKLYKKSIIDKNNIRFDTRFSLGEDSLFVKNYLQHVKGVAITNKCVYKYVHEDTNSLSGRYVENIKDIYSALYDANERLQKQFGQLTNYAPKCITVATAEINNIYKNGSPLKSKKQRIRFIKSRISSEEFKRSFKDWHPTGKPSMISKMVYMLGSAWLIDLVYSKRAK